MKSIEYFLPLIGMFANLLSVIVLKKSLSTLRDQNSRRTIYVSLLRTCLDFGACSGYLISVLTSDYTKLSTPLCCIIQSKSLFWFFINYRAMTNVYSTYKQLQLLVYPSMTPFFNNLVEYLFIFILATVVNIFQSLSLTSVLLRTGECGNCDEFCLQADQTKYFSLYALSVIVVFSFQIYFPVVFNLYLFNQIINILKKCDPLNHKTLTRELKIFKLLDVWFYLCCILFHSICFITNFVTFAPVTKTKSFTYRIFVLLSCAYPTFYPLISTILLNVYRDPWVHLIKDSK